jgi:hypothetical protein
MPKSCKNILLFIFVVISAYLVRDNCYRREAAKIISDSEQGLGQKVNFVPFLIESSMMYSYAQDVALGDGIPEFDDKLAGMADISVNKQFSTGLEYALGYTYQLKNLLFGTQKISIAASQFEDDYAFADWCRIQIRIWASVVSGLIFLWLIALRLPILAALFGGMLHAVAPSAIARYTGQDIVRGNFALPLIVATFLLVYWYLRRPSKLKLIITGIIAFCALATWDMTQICFAIWGLAEIVRLACKPFKHNCINNSLLQSLSPTNFTKRKKVWLTLFIATLFAAFIIPYHRTHMLITSPLVLIVFPVIFTMQFLGEGTLKRRLSILAVSSISFYFIWYGIISLGSFAGNYGHFASLMKAKIRFLNVKPDNPDLLDFDARSIWVPGMHSADRMLMKIFFPIAMNFTVLVLILTFRIKKMRQTFSHNMGLINFPLFMFIFYGLGFFLIVRYHVFTIIFIAVLLPILFHIWMKNAPALTKREIASSVIIAILYFTVFNVYMVNQISPKIVLISMLLPISTILMITVIAAIITYIRKLFKKSSFSVKGFTHTVIILLALFILISELDISLFAQRTYDEHQDFYFAETAGLIKWMREENMEDEIIMADFNLSPLLKAYCKSKIILQPKFELGKTRENYRQFIDIMFHKTEKELADFCEKQNARIFIFDRGYPVSKGLYSPRYIAAAHEIKPKSPVNMMNIKQKKDQLRNFYEIKPPNNLRCINNRYIVFQVITAYDKQQSAKWVKAAEQELKNSNPQFAAKLARAAIFADPLSPKAYLLYRKLFRKSPRITLRGY